MPKENNNTPTGLYWQGKRTEVERISLPFQTMETINESRTTRKKEKDSLLKGLKKKEDTVWYNRLIWGDNKYTNYRCFLKSLLILQFSSIFSG